MRDRGQVGPNGSVDRNNRSQRSIQMPRCPSRGPDLVSTPEHLRPGFRGRTHRYDPSDFGLTGNEEWRHPRMFRNMTYETDAAAMETFRQAQPRRQPYETGMNMSNLPEECLEDMSAPNFDLSLPSQMSDLRGELLADVSAPNMCDVSKTTSHVDNVYGEILDRFKSIRERINRSNQLHGSEDPCYQQTTRRRIYTHRDPSGHVTSHVDETTVSNTSSLDCTPAGEGGEPGRRLNFSLPNRSENLMDESMPPYLEASLEVMSSQDILDNETMPAFESLGPTLRSQNMSHRSCLENETMPSFANISGISRRQQTMPSECLEDVSQPSFERSRSRRQSPRRQQNVSMPSQNLWDISAPSFGNTTRDPTVNECLEDISMPAFEGVSNVSRSRGQSRSQRQRSRNTRNISDISAPTFASSRRGQTTIECLDDMTMPSYGRVSGLSPNRSLRQLRKSMSTQNINDISEPMYASFSRGPMTNECLEEITMPSFGAVSDSSRGRTSRRPSSAFGMPSECLEDMTMPSVGGVSRGSRSRSLDRHQRSMPSSMTDECLDEMTMPSFGGVSGSSRRQITMPSECLDEVSAPTFGRSSSRGSTRRQRTMSSKNIRDTSAPSFANSTKYGDTNECLEDVSMPSFGDVSGSPRRKRSRRQQMTLPTQNIGDISAPSFASSGRRNTTNECLEDITMPSFGGVSNNSRSRSRKRQQSSSHRSMTNECLDDMTMPSMGGVSAMSRRQMTLPSECLNDVSAPTFGRSISRGDSRRQRTLPSASSTRCPPTNEFLEDVTMPSFGGVSSTSRRRQLTMPSECLEDMSAPSFGGVSGPSRRQTTGLPNECLEDISMPTFGNISAISRRNECLPDVSQPALGRGRSLGRSGRSKRNVSRTQATNECLEDVTMPSFGGISGASRRKSTSQHQKTMPPVSEVSERTKECLEDVTMPSFGGVSGSSRARSPRQRSMNSRRGQMTSECLDDETMPSFGGASQHSGRRTPRRQTQNISGISAPSFASSGPGFETNECIEDISMPSYADNTRASRAKSSTSMQRSRHGVMTNECLDDVTMPSFGPASQSPVTNEFLEDISMPSYREHTGSLRRRSHAPVQSSRQEWLDEMTMPSFGGSRRGLTSECLEDISMPAYGEDTGSSRGRSFRQATMTNECLNDMTMPSFASSYRGPVTNEYLEDISMPSYGGISGSSRKSTRQRASIMQRSRPGTMTNERLDDMTMPSFGTSSHGPATNECLEDISMPSYGGNSGLSRGRSTTPMQRSNQGAVTSECLDDMTMPSFGSSSRRPATNECLEDISMPPYGDDSGLSRGRSPMPMQSLKMGAMTNECLDDMTMPSFGSPISGMAYNSGSTRGRSPKQIQIFQGPMTNECLDNMAMPSFGNLSRGPATNECLEDISMPSYRRNTASFSRRSPSPGQRSRQEMTTNECLEDMTMPSYEEVFGSSRRQMTMPSECLNDVSEPSFARSIHEGTSRRQRTLASPNTISRGRSPRPQQMSLTNECLEDMTMPTFGDISGSSRRGQSTMNSVRLEDISMPSGLSNRTQYSECVEDSASGGRGRRTNECLEDVSAPSFAPSSRMTSRHMPHMTDECLEDVSMPQNESLARNDSKSIARRPPDISYPSEMLANESAPSYHSRRDEADKSADCSCSTPPQSSRSRPWEDGSAGRLEDVSMPTFEDVSYQPRRHQLTMPCENLDDETQPDFFNSTALPSSTRAEKHQGKSARQEQQTSSSKQLADESAPSILKDTTKGPSEVVKEVTVQSSTTSVTRIFNKTPETGNNSGQQMIEDLSMPQFETTGSSTHQDSSLHGFQSMDNYRPFDELIYSQNSVGNQTQPQTPQPARGPNRSRSLRRTPSTPNTSNNRGGTPPTATRTPGQPCDMVTTSYPYGKPHCFSRKPC
nr:serine/arginine repetitive matrix protein 2 isoform X2 [Drosophila suzukii]